MVKVNELLENKKLGQKTYDVVIPFVQKLEKENSKLDISYILPGVNQLYSKEHVNYFYVSFREEDKNSLDKLAGDDAELLAKIAERKKKQKQKSAVDVALEAINLAKGVGEITSLEIANVKKGDEFKLGDVVTEKDIEKHFHDNHNIYGKRFVTVLFYFDTKLVKEEKKLGIYSKKKKDQEQIDPKVVKKIQKKAPKLANGKKVLEEGI